MSGKKLNPASKAFVPGGTSPGRKDSKGTAKPAKTAAAKPPAPAAARPAGAWGSKPLDAVRAAPPPSSAPAPSGGPRSSGRDHQQQHNRGGGRGGQQGGGRQGRDGHHHNRNDRNDRGGGGHRRGGNRNNDNRNHNRNRRQESNHPPMPLLDLCVPGQGKTDSQKAVSRIIASDLMAVRLQFLDAPEEGFNPPDHCAWATETRVTEIQEAHQGPNVLGDVSAEKRPRKKPVETAPALEDCKPLEVNDDTRWKAKVFDPDSKETTTDSNEDILKKALLILNKLSLTKFDKLSDAFISTGITKNVDALNGSIGLIVDKAQGEPHFASMYAQLCYKLAKMQLDDIEGLPEKKNTPKEKKKLFKKLLLTRCQQEFEIDTAHKIATAIEGIEDKEEQEYHANLVKKHYLGHMRFIGELYHFDMIKIDIMLFCLESLLTGEVTEEEKKENKDGDDEEADEEKIECFTKLISTIGDSLERQSLALKEAGKTSSFEKLDECWHTVEIMAGVCKEKGPHVSNRVKFMLQDLIEMRDKGWVKRRKEETAKTIEQIHKEVAKEEKRSRRSSSANNLKSMGGRRSSAPDIRTLNKQNAEPKVDNDGFTTVKKIGRSASSNTLIRSRSEGYDMRSGSGSIRKSKRTSSSGSLTGIAEKAEETKETKKPEKKEVAYLSPDECSTKAKNIFKEYFVGGDTDDAVLSIEELIGAGNDGSVERGAKAVESSVLMVMEMKESEVLKAMTVLTKCIEGGKLEKESLAGGFNDPLEFLADIEIDAPLAGSHLAFIIAELIKINAISLSFLLEAPEYFRTDGKAAQFGCKVLKKIGGDASDANLEVVEKLMTCDDKAAHPTARDLLAA